jgi:hypothetical protein
MQPVNTAVKLILKARDDRVKAAKSAKNKSEIDHMSEAKMRRDEKDRVAKMVEENGLGATGVNPSGMFELCGMLSP